MNIEEKIVRLKELFARREEIDAEVAEIIGTESRGGRPRKKAGKKPRRKSKGGRPRKCADWTGKEWSCCGSKARHRHKVGCRKNDGDGKLPPDFRWKCVGCGERAVSAEKEEIYAKNRERNRAHPEYARRAYAKLLKATGHNKSTGKSV